MKRCFAPEGNDCLDCLNGKCYLMEDCTKLGLAYFHCKYMDEKVKVEIPETEEVEWIWLAWGLIACGKCWSDMPGAARTKTKCPRCGAVWVNGGKKINGSKVSA